MVVESEFIPINQLQSPKDALICGLGHGDSAHTITDGVIRGKAGHILRQIARTGEPIFIVRARDLLSIFSVHAYVKSIEDYVPSEMDIQVEVVEALNEMRRWQHDHPDQVRFPD